MRDAQRIVSYENPIAFTCYQTCHSLFSSSESRTNPNEYSLSTIDFVKQEPDNESDLTTRQIRCQHFRNDLFKARSVIFVCTNPDLDLK